MSYAVSRNIDPMPPVIELGGQASLDCDAVWKIAHGAPIAIAPECEERLALSRLSVESCFQSDRLVYGLTTGFGPLADRRVLPEQENDLQDGLINHLATGVGKPFDPVTARAITVSRLNALLQGYSGARQELLELFCNFLNAGFAPVIPERGTVGASGDLTPLSHLALCLSGRGEAFDEAGTRHNSADLFARHGITPLHFVRRDGLAVVNGVSAMTGLAALNSVAAARLEAWATALSAMLIEVLQGNQEAWSAPLLAARPHPGQINVGETLRALLQGGRRANVEPIANQTNVLDRGQRHDAIPQNAYTLRCVPQLIGACQDARAYHDRVVETELNACSDNPVFTHEAPYAVHGGNFFGQHVAHVSDSLSLAVIQLGNLMERQVARLTDERKTTKYRAFLTGSEDGVNSGFMGAQVTATAIICEMRAFSPMSIQTLSTNGDNQDVVTMGTSAARQTRALLDDASYLASILALSCAQAMDLDDDIDAFSPASRSLYAQIRTMSPMLELDRPLSGEIEQVKQYIANNNPTQ